MGTYTAVVLNNVDFDGDPIAYRFIVEAPDEQAARLAIYAVQNDEELLAPVTPDWQLFTLAPSPPCSGPETYDRIRVTGPGTWEWAD
jgi:hypothetical protein